MINRRTMISLAACFLATAPALAQEQPKGPPSASVAIEQIQVAFIGSGAVGGGNLNYHGELLSHHRRRSGYRWHWRVKTDSFGERVWSRATGRFRRSLCSDSQRMGLGRSRKRDAMAAQPQWRHHETEYPAQGIATVSWRGWRGDRFQINGKRVKADKTRTKITRGPGPGRAHHGCAVAENAKAKKQRGEGMSEFYTTHELAALLRVKERKVYDLSPRRRSRSAG